MPPAPATLADIDRAIAELQERRAAELKMDEYRVEFRAFLAERPALNRIEVLRLAREMPGTPERGKPVKSRHAGQATAHRPNNGRSTGKGPRSAAHAAIGKAIAAARAAKELSPQDVGDKIGVSGNSIYGWEAGKWAPAAEVAGKLAKLLGIPVERVTLAKANGHAAP